MRGIRVGAIVVVVLVLAGALDGHAQFTLNPPGITKTFGAASIPVNGTTTLMFHIFNTNSEVSPTGKNLTLHGVSFSDTLPAGLLVASPNGLITTGPCGTISAAPGGDTINLTGATFGTLQFCDFTVNVIGTSPGTKNNTTSPVTAIESGPGPPASASVVVTAGSIPTLSVWVFALLALLLVAVGLRGLGWRLA